MVIALLSVWPALGFPAIPAEDLRPCGTDPVLVAQIGGAKVQPAKEGLVFEEPAVLGPEERSPASGKETEDCAGPGSDKELPRVAIIIDDMGYHQQLGSALLALRLNLTFSFLPHAPFSREQGELAWQMGHDILVHMPMEPQDQGWDPGPGALFLADPQEQLSRKVVQNMAAVPHAIGINNHMGSRYTEDREGMHRFFKLLAGQDLLFVDSLTSSASVAMETARSMGFRAARRDVFLDNVQAQEDICRQIELLIREATARGWAIAIGHPNEATLTALTTCREMLLKRVRLVGIRELAR